MFWETLGSLVLGLAAGYAATRWRPAHFPNHLLVLATGPAAALSGALIARAVLGPGNLGAALVIALGVSVALLSLLVRPRAHRSTHHGYQQHRYIQPQYAHHRPAPPASPAA